MKTMVKMRANGMKLSFAKKLFMFYILLSSLMQQKSGTRMIANTLNGGEVTIRLPYFLSSS